MDLAEQIAALAGGPGFTLAVGVVQRDGDMLRVNLGGAPVAARWPASYVPVAGDPVLCARVGQTWIVVGPTVAEPVSRPPATGTVKAVTAGASTITVTVAGQDMELGYLASYTPVVGHTVALMWTPGWADALVLGQRGSAPVPTPDPPNPARPGDPSSGPAQFGTETFTAVDSATWNVTAGEWQHQHGRRVVTGTVAGWTSAGAWFYGTRPRNALRGRTITKAELYVPNRLRMGNYNQAASLNLYRHTDNTRPSGRRWARAGSAHQVTVQRIGRTTGWVSIPVGWAQQIITDGGGIGVEGGAYLGLPGVGNGANLHPSSGALRLSWER